MNYGYDFVKINSGGFGAMLYDVMNAYAYSKQNNLFFCFIKEGYEIPRLNGSIDDEKLSDKNWHSYFTSFIILERNECIELWPKFIPDTILEKYDIKQYSDLLISFFQLQPEVEDEIKELVKKTPFCPETDIVLHVRRTDKISENPELLSTRQIIKECEYVLDEYSEQTRIYICTDDQSVCEEIKSHFEKKQIEVIWDDSESLEPLQQIRFLNGLKKSIAQKETMNTLKNLNIMTNAKCLIGGRLSYLFRIAELLRYPKKTINYQDNHKFGIAMYSEVNHLIRPYYNRTIPRFISMTDESIEEYLTIYKKTKMVYIPNFISEHLSNEIDLELNNYKWWIYAIMPNNNIWEPSYYAIDSASLNDRFIECQMKLENKEFAYRFKRGTWNHYDTCNCITCKLNDTVRSFHFTDTLCKIIGCRNLINEETFVSSYGKDDFINMHHDKKKGNIAITISLSLDWHPTYGGILHLCDNNNIINSICPKWGSLFLFYLDSQDGMNHFVSSVTVKKNRYTLIAWYTIVK